VLKGILPAALVASSIASPVGAAKLAEWDLAGANGSVSSTVPVALEAPHVFAEPLVAQDNLKPGFISSSTFLFLNWATGPVVDPAKFFEFEVAPEPGYSIDFDTLSLAVAAGGSGTGAFAIRASLDGFASPGQEIVSRTFVQNATWQAFDIDLSALGSKNVPVTFRFYMFMVGPPAYSGLGVNPAFGDQGRNLVLNGTVFEGQAPTTCLPSATTLCIDDQPGDRRFSARVDFETTQGGMPEGAGRAIALGSVGIPSGGIFWFTNPENPEMLLKVLNGCSFNGHYWVFYAAGTNFALRTEVVDTESGAVWLEINPDRVVAPPVADIRAFPCGTLAGMAPPADDGFHWADLVEGWTDPDGAPEAIELDPRAPCTANANTLCIDDQPGDRRFEVTVFYSTTRGAQPMGFGTAIALAPVGVPDGGVFWFQNPQNPEMMIKVLNNCAANGHYWVFYAAGTDLALEVEVMDTVTGAVWRRTNPDRQLALPVADLRAFPCQAP
jgi:hypothetical protein